MLVSLDIVSMLRGPGANYLQRKKGLVSEAGLERLAQRNGFDCLPEDYTAPDGRKMRALIIAGSSTQVEIVMDNNIVQNVTLAFPESSESTSKQMEPASRILLEDLRLPPNQSPLTKTLDKFAFNLERLAVLDKLSIMPAFDCRAALAGIYTSLERLYQWDLSKLRGEDGNSEKLLPSLAMCSKNGQPVMHAHSRVGVAIQYWREGRFIPPESDTTTLFAEKREKIWSLFIGCTAIGGLQLPPARLSDNWISKEIAKDDGLGGDPKAFPLDWQEPENVALPASEETKDVGIEIMQPDLSTIRVPSVMFTVTFDPPMVLPQSDWMRLYACANMEPPPPPPRPPTFDELFFPVPHGALFDPSENRVIQRQRQISVLDKDFKAVEKIHRNSLFIYKQIYSMKLTDMAFSHPKQLISMLPLLRQWAFTSTLLENSFGAQTKDFEKGTAIENKNERQTQELTANIRTMKDELAAFMGSPGKENGNVNDNVEDEATRSRLNMDVIIWVHPTPHFQVSFPFRESTAEITLQILENGVVDVVSENILSQEGGDNGHEKTISRYTLGRALERMEDLCKWAEWIRSRLA